MFYFTADQETNFTPESKRLIETKIKNKTTEFYMKRGYGVSLKDENEVVYRLNFLFNFQFFKL